MGFVDVPGHERFVRNMLAGVGGIDLVLLVIAADESIKPQTREHFDILQLLGVQRGITVLTKSDAVDAETLDVVRLEVEEFLRGTFLGSAAVSDCCREFADRRGAGRSEAGDRSRRPRKSQPRDSAGAGPPADRSRIHHEGIRHGGDRNADLAGTIRREEELEVFPTGRRVRVRGVQVHGQAADAAVAGQRTALNLAGASTEDLSRGMTLAPPATFRHDAPRRCAVAPACLGAAPLKIPDAGAFPFPHDGDGGGDRASWREAACAGRAGVRAAETSRAGTVAARRPVHHPPVFAGGDDRRRQLCWILLRSRACRSTNAFLQILARGEPGTMLRARIARRGTTEFRCRG